VSKITEFARGKECQVRIPDVCNRNPETTVHAHLRMAGFNGMGMKPHDAFGAHACFNCHQAIDRRDYMDLDREYVRGLHKDGVFRTQELLIKAGLLRS